tara:strand:- start:1578 stop:1913 length:336 start_codon:yes stop_codon:yes gene_type:complete
MNNQEAILSSSELNLNTKQTFFSKLNSKEFWEEMEFSRFGLTPILLISVICLSSIAMSFGAGSFDLRLILTAGLSMTFLVSILALLPMKWIFKVTAITVIVDLILLIGTIF